jgi:hypothetical protein
MLNNCHQLVTALGGSTAYEILHEMIGVFLMKSIMFRSFLTKKEYLVLFFLFDQVR